MSTRILQGDVREMLKTLEPDSVDCVVTSPPYWGLRSYLPDDHPNKHLEIGSEPTLAEHLAVLLEVCRDVRRVLKPAGTFWLNYGDCYATAPNGRSAAATKAAGGDDRTFRDKPFSTVGPIYVPNHEAGDRRGGDCKQRTHDVGEKPHTGRIVAGGYLKPKDLCMIPNRLAIALQDDGWFVRSEIIWGKNNPMPDSSGKFRPSTAHEKIFLLAKDADAGGWWVARDTGEVSAVPDLTQRVIMKTSGNEGPRWIELGHYYNAEASVFKASEATHSRLAQAVEKQVGSERANGGRKTNGNMKAVSRKQDGHGRRHDGFNERYFGEQTTVRKKDTEDGARPAGSRPHSLSKFESRKIAEASSGIRNNESMDAALAIMPETRYLRNYEPAPVQVWEMSTQPFSEAHYATFPPELVERCLKAGCPEGGTVLDPFGGAGTVGLVADRMQRHSILIELNEESNEITKRRIKTDAKLFADII